MIRMKSKLLVLILLLSFTTYAKSIYSKYQTSPEFAQFDKVMNQARLPTSKINKNEENIALLESMIEQFDSYPDKSAAYFFMGRCNYKLKNYRTSLQNYRKGIEIDPNLVNRTPVIRFMSTIKPIILRQNNIIISLTFIILWLVSLSVLFFKGIKKSLIRQRQLWAPAIAIIISTLVTIGWFSYNTSSQADGFDGLYVLPVLVRSTIFQIGSFPLVLLALCAVFTSLVTAFAGLVSITLPRFRFTFQLITALVIGSSTTLLYYQFYVLDADRTGTSEHKRVTFAEPPIDWHKDIPDEMMYMYDEKVQALIKKAKAEVKAELEAKVNK